MINPIQTMYRGHRFRSRLEARWAVYFDIIGLKWEYEKEGYNFEGIYYLPDFWFPEVNMWAEVKPSQFDNEEIKKAELLVFYTTFNLILLDGPPDCRSYWVIDYNAVCHEAKSPEYDIVLSMYKDYPRREHRFYADTGYGYPYGLTEKNWEEWMFDDVKMAVDGAMSSRFEHNEKDLISMRNVIDNTIDNLQRQSKC